ncbi:hypothetical protein OH77DRAFT_1464990 [Trametes cingulata]|nr:hypothetical protein OH77DRAFT_1464990 [Trametes cingulata]
MRIRNRGGDPDGTYQWPDRPGPSSVGSGSSTNDNVHVVPDPPKGFPDVPLNYHCASSATDFEIDSGPIPTIPPLGSLENPYVIEDDENARRYRQTLPPPPGLENHGPRRSSSTNRQPANAGSSSSSSKTPVASTSSSRGLANNARAGPSTQEPPIIGRSERYRKTAADGFTPKMPSPLKKLAYKAPSPVIPPMPDRWQIPPRKHSTSSVTVLSVSSSDSEYECE